MIWNVEKMQSLLVLKQMVHTVTAVLSVSLSLSLSFLLFPLWSIGHPWNALFHFIFLILRQTIGLLWRGISPSQGRYLRKHRINAEIHPCLVWDSSPQSQCSSEWRQFMPETARPPDQRRAWLKYESSNETNSRTWHGCGDGIAEAAKHMETDT
jgi:hypothetical protein